MIKIYVKETGDYGSVNLIPYENHNWTGIIKFETIDGEKAIYIQRFIMFFGLIPLWKVWIHENNIIFRDEEVTIHEC